MLIWIVHKAAHVQWVDQKALDEIADLGVEVVVPAATEVVGRPDLERMIRSCVRNGMEPGREDGWGCG